MDDNYLSDELLQEYLAECREHLANIESDLLTIEQNGSAIDDVLVNRVFRAAHSVKGGAGFFDLVKIRDLAHKTENVLDMVRSGQMTPTPEVISVLLLAFDRLRELIQDSANSHQADITEFVDALTRLTSDHLPPEQRHFLQETVSIQVPEVSSTIQVSAFDLNQARRGGKFIYLLQYDLIHDLQRKGKSPLDAVQALVSCGTILETVFDLASAGTLDDLSPNSLHSEVLYATILDPELIGELIEIPPERIRLIEKNGEIRPLSEPTPTPTPSALLESQALSIAPTRPTVAPVSEPVPEAASAHAEIAAAPKAGNAPALAETTIRLNVTLLDSLMSLAGELVLGRNQLNEALGRGDVRATKLGAQRVSIVTSELQEIVTLTRMQPLGNLFGKFQRLTRDLAKDLGKDAELRVEGGEVEIDKTLLEGLSDPLTHMVRNAVDHGIETREARQKTGKPRIGVIRLEASHQAGQVVIEISDDGRGIDPERIADSCVRKGMITREQVDAMSLRDKLGLIFLPGSSTAEKVSDVSGRGVGMDVVKTNLDKLGGKIEIDSVQGKGSKFRIKLPLTLAIIPSLLVSDCGDRFAIPQMNVSELIRITPRQLAQRIDKVGDADVLILRDRLVPLLYLSSAMGEPMRDKSQKAMYIVLVDTGAFQYGLVVEQLHDTVEIVVKPLGRHLRKIRDYAGATVLGDGCVALILDVAGIAARGGMTAASVNTAEKAKEEIQTYTDVASLLLVHNAPSESCAIPIELVSRVEHILPKQVEFLGGRRTMQYRGSSIHLITLHDVAKVQELSEEQEWVVVIFERQGKPIGLLAAAPLDMLETELTIDSVTLRQPGIAGSAILKSRTTLLLDLFEMADRCLPAEPVQANEPASGLAKLAGRIADNPGTVLLAEDSAFFRGQIRKLIESVGYRVLEAGDGLAAWQLLDQHASEVDIVATDIEMPRMDGLALTRQIRADGRFKDLPVIALTSLAGEAEIEKGMAAGVTEYQVKLNPEELLGSISRAVRLREHAPVAATVSN